MRLPAMELLPAQSAAEVGMPDFRVGADAGEQKELRCWRLTMRLAIDLSGLWEAPFEREVTTWWARAGETEAVCDQRGARDRCEALELISQCWLG